MTIPFFAASVFVVSGDGADVVGCGHAGTPLRLPDHDHDADPRPLVLVGADIGGMQAVEHALAA